MRKLLALAVFLALAAAAPVSAQAQEEGGSGPPPAEANNPLAMFRAFNLHNYYTTFSGPEDQAADTLWLRYAQPFGKWLCRASLPLSRVPAGDGENASGLGDLNAFAAYQFDTGDPKLRFGVGPQLTAPTASEDETGTGQWQAGLAAVFFNMRSPGVQWGGLVTWQADFAGDEDRPGTNVLAVQPLFFAGLGGGLYMRSSAIAVFDLENDTYNVPFGLGIGKIVPAGNKSFNIFVEPQFTVLDHGAGQPELQIFIGLNTQFAIK